ncbi:MAG: tetratricopeptide repeat protein, partial [Hyphomicrobiales bacterium]
TTTAPSSSTAIRLDPRFAGAYEGRGLTLSRKGDQDRALSDLDEAIRLDPSRASAFLDRGVVYARKGDYRRAIAEYEEAMRLKPDFALAFNNRGWAYRKLGDAERALEDANTAIRLDRKLALAYATRGHVWLDRRDIARAIADFSEAIRLDAMLATAFSGRGLAYERKGQTDRAIADYRAALALPVRDANVSEAQAAARARLAELTASKPGPGPEIVQPRPALPQAPAPVISPPAAAMPAPSPAPAVVPIPPAPATPLAEALATCDKAAANIEQIVLPGAKEPVRLDRCYRGRDHLVCTAAALRAEAEAITREFRSIVEPNYPDVKDIDAICRFEPSRLGEDARRAAGFDARWNHLKAEFDKSVNCSDKIEESIRNISLPSLPRAADIMGSMVAAISADIRGVSANQKKVLELADKIEASRKAMATIQQIAAGICLRKRDGQ